VPLQIYEYYDILCQTASHELMATCNDFQGLLLHVSVHEAVNECVKNVASA